MFWQQWMQLWSLNWLKSIRYLIESVNILDHLKFDHLQVRGYPTLKLFSNGQEVEDYKGGRTRKDIVAYITEKAKATRNEL